MKQTIDEIFLQETIQTLLAAPCAVLKESRPSEIIPLVGVMCGEELDSEAWISLTWNASTVLFGFELYEYFKSIGLPARISRKPNRIIHRYIIQNESQILGYFYASINSPPHRCASTQWYPEVCGRVKIFKNNQSFILKRGEDFFNLTWNDSAFIIGEKIMKNIHLTVTVGTLELSLQDIADLRPGTIIEIANPEVTPLTLSVGGCPIAEGKFINQGIEIQKVHTKLLSENPELYL